jgi:hypothetical protein
MCAARQFDVSRADYSQAKREREAQRARKQREKAEKRMHKREMGPGRVEITTAEAVVGVMPSIEEAERNMQARAASPQAGHTIPCRLFVGGLSWDTGEQSLRTAFGAYGAVADAFVVTDRNSGQSRGFGFVTYADRRDATKAIEMLNGAELDGRRIVVNVATDRPR